MLKIIKLLSRLSILIIYANCAFSQNYSVVSERNLNLNIKQFNEFVNRFNYTSDFKGNPIDSVFKSKISRKDYLGLLINKDDQRLNKNTSEYDSLYKSSIENFIDDIVSRHALINKYSEEIIAEAKASVIYHGKKQEISIYLNQEIENDGVKWVLLSVKADFLNVLKEDTSLLRFIPPTSNEVNFISLKRVFSDTNYQQYYTHKNFIYDPLSSFLYALNNGEIQYQYVNNITYHIFDVDGWCIEVKEFIRNSENSGWLIADIVRVENSLNQSLEDLINK